MRYMTMRWTILVALAACGGTTAQSPDAPLVSDTGACDVAPDICAGHAGTFHEQRISVDGEDRVFWLHVPAKAVGQPAALLIDFHGTGFVDSEPELEWGTDELLAVSDDLGFIVARPRAHPFSDGGQTVYQWDDLPGDIDKNRHLATALVDLVESHYAINPARVYAVGFSNGSNIALQTLGIPDTPFRGFGLVGGGIYEPFDLSQLPSPAPRIYDTTGYRDLNYLFERDMISWLKGYGFPLENVFLRETKAIHELRGWQYAEMFSWLDQGTRRQDAPLGSGWTSEAFQDPATLVSWIGTQLATTAAGSIYTRDAQAAWHSVFAGSGSPVLVAGCTSGNLGFATGETTNFVSGDGGATWKQAAAIPPFGAAVGASQLFDVACQGQHLVGAGFGVSAASDDGGATWHPASLIAGGGFDAETLAIRRGSSGAYVAIGLAYAGRSEDGTTFVASDIGDGYFYDVAEAAPGHWWAVGDDGLLASSDDDGVTWKVSPPVAGDALYAVRFANATTGMAVGLHGTAVVTVDGGATWQARPAGVDRMLGDVQWTDATHAVVIGERGTVLDFTP